ncbi:MAG: class I SAM-dependent methyltransferase [Nitrosomonas sp.]
MDESKIISSVKQQYEALPYPPRNPSDEKSRLLRTVGDSLTELNHWCFKGQRNFDQDFRCLVAGGGTGDSIIYLAEQLRGTSAEIVYLDMSKASRSIAEQRAAVRGLDNITWLTESLLSIPELGIGKFDYINCSGVLHHLNNPVEGARALASALKDDGAMYLMLYAEYGRSAVYLMQTLFRELIPQHLSIQEKVNMARRIIGSLPAHHAFIKDLDKWANEITASGYGDSGLYDLLLHSVDRCYNVNEVYELAAAAELRLVNFLGSDKRYYDPAQLVAEESILAAWRQKSLQAQQSIAEKLFSHHIKHQCYLSRQTACTASMDNEDNAIILENELANQNMAIHEAIKPGETLSITFTINHEKTVFQLSGNKVNKACFRYMDGKTPISSIIHKVKMKCGDSEQKIRSELRSIFEILFPMGCIFLQRP